MSRLFMHHYIRSRTQHGERGGLLLDEREAFLFRLPATMMRVAKELLIEVCTLPQAVSAAACRPICRLATSAY